ncbi:MAG: MptD family putative ECF transporter S component [Coriobacteriales bacterium]|jgi:energy-coupling factor transport system substrate-specific component|nr:MptD family putative ECF transporter S component [Coriobacteriales bacterium]
MTKTSEPVMSGRGKNPVSNRLVPKDLINIGLFTALYFVICFAVAMLGYIPIFIPLLAVLVPLIGGIPFMLFLTKVKKFGMVLIMGILVGLIYTLLGGLSTWALAFTILFSLIAELLLRSGAYKSGKRAILSYGIFSLWLMGQFLPIFVARDAYYEMLASGSFGVEYANALMSFMPEWIAPVLVLCCFAFGVLGGLLGRAIMRKHFQRAGIV